MKTTKTARSVRMILQNKGNAAWAIDPEASVYQALELLAEKDIGALLVMQDDDLLGIISERDYARRVEREGRTAHETRVRDIMTEKVFSVEPDQTVDDCMALMTEKRIRHLPVLEGGRISGVISIGDVVKDLIAEQAFMIDQLENYISGTS
jgi:CBS domain-containing protein